MEALARNDEERETNDRSELRELRNEDQLKHLLADVIASSKGLDARVRLDGVYTEIANENALGGWRNDRDVYFKVKGRIDKRRTILQ